MTMTELEVRVVANGFIVLPCQCPGTLFSWTDEVYAFETFEALSAFLKENLKRTVEYE